MTGVVGVEIKYERTFCYRILARSKIPGGVLGYKRDGGVRRIFLGLKFSTHNDDDDDDDDDDDNDNDNDDDDNDDDNHYKLTHYI